MSSESIGKLYSYIYPTLHHNQDVTQGQFLFLDCVFFSPG